METADGGYRGDRDVRNLLMRKSFREEESVLIEMCAAWRGVIAMGNGRTMLGRCKYIFIYRLYFDIQQTSTQVQLSSTSFIQLSHPHHDHDHRAPPSSRFCVINAHSR